MAIIYIFVVLALLDGEITDMKGSMFPTLRECRAVRTTVMESMEGMKGADEIFRVSDCEIVFLYKPMFGQRAEQ